MLIFYVQVSLLLCTLRCLPLYLPLHCPHLCVILWYKWLSVLCFCSSPSVPIVVSAVYNNLFEFVACVLGLLGPSQTRKPFLPATTIRSLRRKVGFESTAKPHYNYMTVCIKQTKVPYFTCRTSSTHGYGIYKRIHWHNHFP